MKSSKSLAFSDPKLDFAFKNYLVLTVVPWLVMYIWISVFYLLGRSLWERRGEGAFVYSIWAIFSGYFIYLVFLCLSVLFILFFNRRWMSGDKLTKKTRFGLFGLAFVFYLVTMWVVSLVV